MKISAVIAFCVLGLVSAQDPPKFPKGQPGGGLPKGGPGGAKGAPGGFKGKGGGAPGGPGGFKIPEGFKGTLWSVITSTFRVVTLSEATGSQPCLRTCY